MNNERIPQTVYKLKNNIIFGVGTTLFVLLFSVIYTPTFGKNDISAWHEHSSLSISVISAIVLAVISLSRTLLLLTTRQNRLHTLDYMLWQVVEIAVIGLFANLYISIFFHCNYFEMLHVSLLVAVAVLIFPYIIYWLYIELTDHNSRLAEAQHTIVELQQASYHDSDSPIRFVDEKGLVRLVVVPTSVIAIESAGNYVTVIYENNGRVTRFSLRNTLKGIEDLCHSNSLVRCHRSYFVNLNRVKLLRKDSDGIYAEIDADGVADIPVSKTYSAEVIKLFSTI